MYEQWEWTGNEIGNEGVQTLSESLKINITLTEMDLDGETLNVKESKMKMKINGKWKWTDNQIGSEGAQSLSESLKINTILTQMDLSCDEDDLQF